MENILSGLDLQENFMGGTLKQIPSNQSQELMCNVKCITEAACIAMDWIWPWWTDSGWW